MGEVGPFSIPTREACEAKARLSITSSSSCAACPTSFEMFWSALSMPSDRLGWFSGDVMFEHTRQGS